MTSAAAIAAAALAFSSAHAASPQTTPVTVGATVSASCQVNSAGNLNFGNYDVFSASSTPGSSTISITCSAGSSITVALSVGSNSTSFNPRTMKDSGGNVLNYNLYTTSVTNSGCTGGTIWGDGTASTVTEPNPSTPALVASSRFTPVPLTVFGCIPSGQDVKGGPTETYTDVITVTVSFL
jgi:spore coat protein U-like protein